MTAHRNLRDIIINVLSQLVWVVMVAGSTATLLFLFGTTDLREIAGAQVEVPAIVILSQD